MALVRSTDPCDVISEIIEVIKSSVGTVVSSMSLTWRPRPCGTNLSLITSMDNRRWIATLIWSLRVKAGAQSLPLTIGRKLRGASISSPWRRRIGTLDSFFLSQLYKHTLLRFLYSVSASHISHMGKAHWATSESVGGSLSIKSV